MLNVKLILDVVQKVDSRFHPGGFFVVPGFGPVLRTSREERNIQLYFNTSAASNESTTHFFQCFGMAAPVGLHPGWKPAFIFPEALVVSEPCVAGGDVLAGAG